MVTRPYGSGDFAREDDQRGRRAPTVRAVRFIEWFPACGFDGRHRGVKQQATRFGGAAFG